MAAKKKPARKAREWTMSVTRSGLLLPLYTLRTHYGDSKVRVREVLPRKRGGKR